MTRPIAISISPNTDASDVRAAARELTRPWTWTDERDVRALEARFAARFGGRAFAFESARSGLYALLAAMGLSPDDEALLQAFTCVAVPNAVLWAGGRPVYVDMDPRTYNIDPADLERKLTPRSRAVIVQHTFGIPCDLDAVTEIAGRRRLLLIEDCAHALGGSHGGRELGTFGDAAVFSFGRDKVISSVFGGMLVVREPELAERVAALYERLRLPSRRWIAQQLLHPVATNVAVLPLYFRARIGVALLVGLQRAGLLSRAVAPEELRGGRPSGWVRRLPAPLARLAARQLDRLDALNAHRRAMADIYRAELDGMALPALHDPGDVPVYLRFPVATWERDAIIARARQKRILLDKWYDAPVAPAGVDLAAVRYVPGSCPNVEAACAATLNLPTHPRIDADDARAIARLVRERIEMAA
ncbi:MAG TPA: DegT/DnrJ/EryC1/StrS family aminotransferase [Dehalococcoidia bacterium]|nr:DegT/DnrJ/EryC1/StrS family aminotransferase [Dehalococcoidia bacterium]